MPALPVQLYQAWLLFLYTTLALRENILRVNGSDNSWIYHHYCAMVMALMSLTWEIKGQPDCAMKHKGVQLFLGWALMQGFAMLLQNSYLESKARARKDKGVAWAIVAAGWSSALPVVGGAGERRTACSGSGCPDGSLCASDIWLQF
ncbi:transmembrane protein 120 [Carex littledalei]|uniref:Transmembrane protein 120 n=1 Tax=Carex littledalei TaxID=544730 RepID=A0A833RE52_9POAL|nr:transmembrane protein 120 [Carex littledalei]